MDSNNETRYENKTESRRIELLLRDSFLSTFPSRRHYKVRNFRLNLTRLLRKIIAVRYGEG